jgi:hypothetical protein
LDGGADRAHVCRDQAAASGRSDRSRRRRQRQPLGRLSTIMQNARTAQTTPLQLILAWSFAGIPLLAGVAQTLVNAMKLFQ